MKNIYLAVVFANAIALLALFVFPYVLAPLINTDTLLLTLPAAFLLFAGPILSPLYALIIYTSLARHGKGRLIGAIILAVVMSVPIAYLLWMHTCLLYSSGHCSNSDELWAYVILFLLPVLPVLYFRFRNE